MILLLINPVDQKHANGKMCPGKSWYKEFQFHIFLKINNDDCTVSRFVKNIEYIVGKMKKSLYFEDFLFSSKSELMSVLCSQFSALCIFQGRGWWCENISKIFLKVGGWWCRNISKYFKGEGDDAKTFQNISKYEGDDAKKSSNTGCQSYILSSENVLEQTCFWCLIRFVCSCHIFRMFLWQIEPYIYPRARDGIIDSSYTASSSFTYNWCSHLL